MADTFGVKLHIYHDGKWNLPFSEALDAAKERGVVLPDVYYGELQGIARQQSFSVAGLAALDQLQAVKDSLDKAMAQGLSFGEWQKQAAVAELGLPKHRLDNIFRTNLQGNYQAGQWEQFEANRDNRPYLMYDAINDSRVRPTHLAMDGKIWHIDDPQLDTHAPINGYRCRCSLIPLGESEALARSRGGQGLHKVLVTPDGQPAGPDKGFEYSPRNRMAGVKKAVEDRRKTTTPMLYSAMGQLVSEYTAITTMIRQAIGPEAYDAAKAELATRNLPGNLSEAEQVALYAWTMDTNKDALYVRVNSDLRAAGGGEAWRSLVEIIESGLSKLPNYVGEVFRGVKESRLGKQGFNDLVSSHKVGVTVEYAGFTSSTVDYTESLRGRLKLRISSVSGKSIADFSVKPSQQEVLFKTGSKFKVADKTVRADGVVEIWLIQQEQ